jgi:AraC family transcriptional regulator
MGSLLQIGEYFGPVRRQEQFAGAVVTEVVHDTERRLPLHRHAVPYFCLIPSGAYLEQVEGRELEYGPFSVGFHPPVSHRDRIGRKGAVFFFVEVRPEWLDRAANLLPAHADYEPRLLEGDLSCLATRLYRLHAEETLGSEVVDGALWELVGCVTRDGHIAERRQPRWLSSCVDLLRAHFSRPLTILEIASAVDVHPVHLSREFRGRFGQTVGEYLHKLRIRAACDALGDPAQSLSDVAAAVGFADQSHFCRVFKSHIGCSPGRFRRLTARAQGLEDSSRGAARC